MAVFFLNDTAPPEISSLPLHDALQIFHLPAPATPLIGRRAEIGEARTLLAEHRVVTLLGPGGAGKTRLARSEEHTSELQSRQYLVCRLLLEKNKRLIYLHLAW